MPAAVDAPTVTAPPADPVRAALDDPEQRRKLAAHTHAILRGRFTEDVVQDVCQRAWAARAGYDPTRGPVSAWLAGFTANVCREKARADARRPQPTDFLDRLAVARPEQDLDQTDARFLVERFLDKLSDTERAAVKLRHLDELEYTDIAARLGITPLNARQRVRRGLNRLRQIARQSHGEGRV